jgi:hypothetical protein
VLHTKRRQNIVTANYFIVTSQCNHSNWDAARRNIRNNDDSKKVQDRAANEHQLRIEPKKKLKANQSILL